MSFHIKKNEYKSKRDSFYQQKKKIFSPGFHWNEQKIEFAKKNLVHFDFQQNFFYYFVWFMCSPWKYSVNLFCSTLFSGINIHVWIDFFYFVGLDFELLFGANEENKITGKYCWQYFVIGYMGEPDSAKNS